MRFSWLTTVQQSESEWAKIKQRSVERDAQVAIVGIGSDADLHGYDDMIPAEYAALKGSYKGSYAFRDKIDIDGFDHPLKVFDLTEELIRRGYSNDNITARLTDTTHYTGN